MLQILLSLTYSQTYTYSCASSSSCNSIQVELKRGMYLFECWGAQGGNGCTNGKLSYSGGNGAYVSGYINLLENTTFYLYIGGKGGNPTCKTNSVAAAGWNGGGNGGKDTRDDDSSGGGGGSSDIRLVPGDANSFSSLVSRIMVAAGGSGSVHGSHGAPGGTLSGLRKYGAGINDIQQSPSTTQISGNQIGQGAGGKAHQYTPSSGAGGGYYGGIARSGIQSPTYSAVSDSGSSYISGHSSCNSMSSSGVHLNSIYHYSGMKFYNTTMVNGVGSQPHPTNSNTMIGNSGNGAIRITYIKDYYIITQESPENVYIPQIIYGIIFLLTLI